MLKELRVDNSAPWKQRFHASTIFWTMIAAEEPTRGLVASNLSGIAQLYAWDVPTSTLTQVERSVEHQELMLRFAYRVLAQD